MTEEEVRKTYEEGRSLSLDEVLKQAGIRPDFTVESSDLITPLSPRYSEERTPQPDVPAAEAA